MTTTIRTIGMALVATCGLVAVAAAAPRGHQDIVEVAAAAPNFHTLVKALKAADMVDTLKGPGPFTVFAPTDEAFAKIAPDQLDALLKDKPRLKQVLSNHVVSGDLTANKLMSGMAITSLDGQQLPVSTTGATTRIGEAKVVKANIPASNGEIHAIDTVLMPR